MLAYSAILYWKTVTSVKEKKERGEIRDKKSLSGNITSFDSGNWHFFFSLMVQKPLQNMGVMGAFAMFSSNTIFTISNKSKDDL